jgi:hypothetical protein
MRSILASPDELMRWCLKVSVDGVRLLLLLLEVAAVEAVAPSSSSIGVHAISSKLGTRGLKSGWAHSSGVAMVTMY